MLAIADYTQQLTIEGEQGSWYSLCHHWAILEEDRGGGHGAHRPEWPGVLGQWSVATGAVKSAKARLVGIHAILCTTLQQSGWL